MYLAYTPLEGLSPTEIYTLATDMALASVTGDDIFNFGKNKIYSKISTSIRIYTGTQICFYSLSRVLLTKQYTFDIFL